MIFGNLDVQIIILLIPALVFSLSFHEFAHAIQACANSWNDNANINVGISKIRVSGESLKRMVSSLDDEFYIPLSNNVYQCGCIFVL